MTYRIVGHGDDLAIVDTLGGVEYDNLTQHEAPEILEALNEGVGPEWEAVEAYIRNKKVMICGACGGDNITGPFFADNVEPHGERHTDEYYRCARCGAIDPDDVHADVEGCGVVEEIP